MQHLIIGHEISPCRQSSQTSSCHLFWEYHPAKSRSRTSAWRKPHRISGCILHIFIHFIPVDLTTFNLCSRHTRSITFSLFFQYCSELFCRCIFLKTKIWAILHNILWTVFKMNVVPHTLDIQPFAIGQPCTALKCTVVYYISLLRHVLSGALKASILMYN